MTTASKYRAKREHEVLASYLKAARAFPPLTREEERALAVRARQGDTAAKQKLVQHNLAFVIGFARRQRRGTVPLDDLIQEGSAGLLRAVEKFDPESGNRFLTYGAWWVRAYIGRYLEGARSTVKGQGWTAAQRDVSLDSPSSDGGDDAPIDRLEDGAPSPEDACLVGETRREVRQALARVRGRVSELGWDIVRERLEQDSPLTLQELGRRWGVSRERVRQVEVATRRLLRRQLEESGVARDAA
jgi:RNA polymerase primary sigma factor